MFGTDLPRTWLVTVFCSVLHAAATQTRARRLRASEAASVLERTLLATPLPDDLTPRSDDLDGQDEHVEFVLEDLFRRQLPKMRKGGP